MNKGLLKFLASLSVLAGLLWWIGPEQIFARLRDAHLGWLALGLLALILSTLSMARRWQMTVQRLDMDLSFGHALREYYLAQFINSVLPGGVLGDVGRAVRVRHRGDLQRAGQSVVAERLVGQVAMFAILGGGLTVAFLLPGGLDWPWWLPFALPAVIFVLAVLVLFTRKVETIRRFSMLVLNLLRNPVILAHAFGAAGLLIFSLYACARATGTPVPPEGLFTILPMIFCAMLIPLSVAGWGWREGAAAVLFPMIGASASAGVAVGLCYGVLMLLATLPATVFMVLPSEARRAQSKVETT